MRDSRTVSAAMVMTFSNLMMFLVCFLQEVMDEPATYADLPEETRENMIRKVYLSGGKYTIEVKSGQESHSTSLQVGSPNSGGRGRSRRADAHEEGEIEDY